MKSFKYLNLNSVATLIIATPFLMVLSRNIASPVFVVVTTMLAAIAWKEQGQDRLFRSIKTIATSKVTAVFVLLILFMAASSSWSTSLVRGLESTAHLAGNLLMLALSLAALSVLDLRLCRRSWVLPLALIAAAAIILCELHLGSPIRGLLGGSDEAFRMNRAAVAIVLFLPVTLTLLPKTFAFGVLRIVALLAVGYAAFSSESESAKLAFVVVLVSFPVFLLLKIRGIWFLGGLALLSLVAMPIIVPHLMSLIPQSVESQLPYGSFGIRADIWSAHASLLINSPILGHGVEASIMAAEDYKYSGIPELFLSWGHPHNFAIQVWYELGLIGVVLFSGLVYLFFRSLREVPDVFLPALLTTATAVWAVSLVSHGAWQAWWWCLIALLSLLWLIELQNVEKRKEEPN